MKKNNSRQKNTRKIISGTTIGSCFAAFIFALVFAGAPITTHATTLNTSITTRVPGSGLVGWWTMDGKDINWAAGTMTDRSGTNNTANFVAISTSTSPKPGIVGQALSFDGSTGHKISIAHAASLDFEKTDSFTLSAWVKIATTTPPAGGEFSILSKVSVSGVIGYFFYVAPTTAFSENAKSLSLLIHDTASHGFEIESPTNSIQIGKWQHVVATYDGSLVNAGAQLYINGVLQTKTVVSSSAFTTSIKTTTPVLIGDDNTNDWMNGSVDDERIYNRVLSQTEITALYNAGSGIAANTTSQNSRIASGLVGWWSFDGKDMTSGVAQDRSGQGNNGNLSSIATSTFYKVGKIGQAARFDGVDDCVDAGSPSALNITGALTLSVWVRPNSSALNRGVVTKATVGGSSASDQYRIYDSGSNKFSLALENAALGSNLVVQTASNAVPNNTWSHIVGVYDGVDTAKIYLNGALVNTTTIAGYGALNSSGKNFEIGNSHGSNKCNGSVFDGSIDDVRVYNRALTATEVASLYQSGGGTAQNVSTNMNGRLTSGLVGYWSFDGKDMPSGRLNDVSGNGNTGNVLNIATSTFYAPGQIGQAGNFDGVNDVAKFTQTSGLPVFTTANAGSVAFWVKGSSGDSQTIWGESNSAGSPIYSLVKDNTICTGHATGKICAQIRNDAGSSRLLQASSATVFDNKWHHVVWTDNAGAGILYVDGVRDTNTFTYTPSGSLTSVTDCVGALCRGTNASFYNGSVDDVRAYNRVLSATEVTTLYNMGR